MTQDSPTPEYADAVRGLAVALGLLGVLAATGVQPAAQPQSTPTNVHAAALQDFQQRLQAYLALRQTLARKLKPLAPSASSAGITSRQDALAAALREARQGARRGDMIPERTASFIRDTIAADFRKRRAAAQHGEVREIPQNVVPVINRTYPAQAALPTMPPLLLKELPVLPDDLQYRFFGRHVVILDADTQIITDYIADVLPSH